MFVRGELIELCIEIDDYGKINKIKKSMDKCEKIDGVILPGGIDLHVHFREPGYEKKEDFYTGSMSAAFGGITFVADMPNNQPRIDSKEIWEEKREIVKNKANVDYTLFAMLTSENGDFKVPAPYKWYMYEENIEKEKISKDIFITVHSEMKECISSANSLRDYDFARPESCERKAIRKLGEYERKFHIAHISSIDSVELCKIFGFTCEVTPHHLFLHRDMNLGAWGKVNPPLRAKCQSDRLWDALLDGRIDIVASDHAPHTVEEKERKFEEAPPGIPEVETYLPIFMYLVKAGRISLKRAVEVLMNRPGEILGVKKGKIEEGYDADFIALDFGDVKKIDAKKLHYKCGWTPYEGFYGIFPHTVIIRGEKIIEDGELAGERMGKFIPLHSGEES